MIGDMETFDGKQLNRYSRCLAKTLTKTGWLLISSEFVDCITSYRDKIRYDKEFMLVACDDKHHFEL